MPRKRVKVTNVMWLSDEISNDSIVNSFRYYKKFTFNGIVGEIGDYVLISNADAAESDTEEGCDAAKILTLYEDESNNRDPFRAKVQWYSRPSSLPKGCDVGNIVFYDEELIEDHRPFDTDVSIETIFKKCNITFTFTKDTDEFLKGKFSYICRYRLMAASKRKFYIQPVLEDERKAQQLLSTPSKNATPKPKTPSTLVKQMENVTITGKQWNVVKNVGTKVLLKRALTDRNEKKSPKKSTPQRIQNTLLPETPKSSRTLRRPIKEIIPMKLIENSDNELPTLIVRENYLSTPKRKSPPKLRNEKSNKPLVFEEDESEIYTSRSGRVTRHRPYCENTSPIRQNPRRILTSDILSCDSEDEYKDLSMTPKAPKSPRTPRARRIPPTPRTPQTPRNRNSPAKTPNKSVKRILTSELTPTLHTRMHSVNNIEEIFVNDKSLPCREKQAQEILSFVRSNLLQGESGTMYISGVPGTGKTATVNSAITVLKEEPDLPEFQLVEVNGMRITEPRQAYVQIYKQLTGKSLVWEQACSLLETRFQRQEPRRKPTVLVVDELDVLCNRRQDVLYSIMDWATQKTAKLTVLAIANTMDLPERALAARVASRVGLTRLTFPPYTYTQLQCIVASRLSGANITADAVMLIARKVAAVSGDARRVLTLCARALEIAGSNCAGVKEVNLALKEFASEATVRAIRNCSPAEKLMLRALAAEVERTGSDETTLSRALATAADIVALEGRPYRSAPSIRAPTPSQAQTICARLAAMKLLLMEKKPSEPRLMLNVSADDVHYATKQITV